MQQLAAFLGHWPLRTLEENEPEESGGERKGGEKMGEGRAGKRKGEREGRGGNRRIRKERRQGKGRKWKTEEGKEQLGSAAAMFVVKLLVHFEVPKYCLNLELGKSVIAPRKTKWNKEEKSKELFWPFVARDLLVKTDIMAVITVIYNCFVYIYI